MLATLPQRVTAAVPSHAETVLSAEALAIVHRSGKRLVEGVGFELRAGHTLALVGESGSGKSLTALSLMGLLPRPAVRLEAGSIRLGGSNLAAMSEAKLRALRGASIAMIFQEPLSALNPVMTVGRQIGEAVHTHTGLGGKALAARIVELLELVRIPDAKRRAKAYPHQLSGGMRQRVLIAMAMAANPRVLIADEPTTALDVTVQADILDTIQDLQARLGLAVLLISHDLGLVADRADEVAVMYSGRLVEYGSATEVLDRPLHPYTKGLLAARPSHSGRAANGGWASLVEIPGLPPQTGAETIGCAFAPRCGHVMERCRTARPGWTGQRNGRGAACFKLTGGP